MASVRLFLDTRRPKADGSFPVKLVARHHATMMIATRFTARPEQWTGSEYAKGTPQARARNIVLRELLNKAEGAIIDLERTGKLRATSDTALRQLIEHAVGSNATRERLFIDVLDEFITRQRNAGTRTVYTTTRNKLAAYAPAATFATMDARWLEAFDAHMAETMKTNARAIHLRNIRAVFNYAIDQEYTELYPFRRFSIKHEATRKRCLTVDDLRTLRDYPCEPHQCRYRDMFMLMFYLIGVNAADLFRARPADVHGGRLEYRRAKTGRLYSVKIEPEAQSLIDRYRGREYLLDVCDTYADYRNFLHRMDMELKRVGPVTRSGLGGKKQRTPLFPDLSSYWSRHTWATIAASIDVPVETISAALGHAFGSPTTAIYIALDPRKVDTANRRVLDAVANSVQTI